MNVKCSMYQGQSGRSGKSHRKCRYIFTFHFIWSSCHQPRMRKVIKNHFLYLYGFPYTIERGSKCNIRWKYVSSFYSPSWPFNLWQCFENVFYFSTIHSCYPYAMYNVSAIASLCDSVRQMKCPPFRLYADSTSERKTNGKTIINTLHNGKYIFILRSRIIRRRKRNEKKEI